MIPSLLDDCLSDPLDQRLARAILGESDPSKVRSEVEALCREHLNADVARVHFCRFGVGVAFGLVLADGRTVFLKVWSPETDAGMLQAVSMVQDGLARAGFPAPPILLPPTRLMAGHAVVMGWNDFGALPDATHADVRREMASALSRQIELARSWIELPGLPRLEYPPARVWGVPHNALFDFEATAAGAEWIDELGTAAAESARRPAGRLIVGHRDWRAGNMRLARGTVSIVYDWDALALAREPQIVGMAAAVFPVAHEEGRVARFPSPDDMAAFMADYMSASGRSFADDEKRVAWGAALYLLAYTARCEHCYDPAVASDGVAALLRGHQRTLLAACR